MDFKQGADPFLRNNFLFKVVGPGEIKAKPNKAAEWRSHTLNPAIKKTPTQHDDLDSLSEDSFYGQSETRKKRLTPQNEKRKPKKRKMEDFLEPSESEFSLSDGSNPPKPVNNSRKKPRRE